MSGRSRGKHEARPTHRILRGIGLAVLIFVMMTVELLVIMTLLVFYGDKLIKAILP